MKNLVVYGVQCLNCGDTIFSRTKHDFRACSCFRDEVDNKGCAIDGGFNYVKFCGNVSGKRFVYITLKEGVDVPKLFQDYNLFEDIYGKFSYNEVLPSYVLKVEKSKVEM